MGKKEEGRGQGSGASEDAATLPNRGHRLAGPGACLGHPEYQSQSQGWDPDVLMSCRPRAVVAQAWCPAPGHANENTLQLISALESHTSKKHTAKTQEAGRAGLIDSLEMTSSYWRHTPGAPPALPPSISSPQVSHSTLNVLHFTVYKAHLFPSSPTVILRPK